LVLAVSAAADGAMNPVTGITWLTVTASLPIFSGAVRNEFGRLSRNRSTPAGGS
jgi:hypothetical protein